MPAQFAPLPFSAGQRQRIAEADAFIGEHLADPSARPELVRQKYARASLFYAARHWPEAAMAYLDIALNYPDDELGLRSAIGYMESANVLGVRTEPSRAACFDDMARYTDLFLDAYCRGTVLSPGRSSCANLFRVQTDITRARVHDAVEHPPLDPDERLHAYAEAAVIYFERARACFTFALRFGYSPKAERCDELAYYAGHASMLAGLPTRAKHALAILRARENQVNSSDYTRRLAQEIDRTRPSRSCCTHVDCAPTDGPRRPVRPIE